MSETPTPGPDDPEEPPSAPVVATGSEGSSGTGSAAPAEPAASQLPHDDPSPVRHDVAEGERGDDEESGRHQEDDAASEGSGSG